MRYNAASFSVVVLRRSPSGELQLIRRGRTSYMYCPKARISYFGFLEPAT